MIVLLMMLLLVAALTAADQTPAATIPASAAAARDTIGSSAGSATSNTSSSSLHTSIIINGGGAASAPATDTVATTSRSITSDAAFATTAAATTGAVANVTTATTNSNHSNGDYFEGCTEYCGWVATLVAALCFGSYGVPIKETSRVDVHPLVLQSYKTFTFAATSWLVVPLAGVIPAWTNWGLLSGLLWVVGGSWGVYGIRAAGMAVAVGTWASVMIAVNFVWGVLIFQEPVADVTSTLSAFACLGCGVVGMAIYSSPRRKKKVLPAAEPNKGTDDSETEFLVGTPTVEKIMTTTPQHVDVTRRRTDAARDPLNDEFENSIVNVEPEDCRRSNDVASQVAPVADAVVVPRIPGLSLRASGIVGAMVNGLLSGSSLIPVHYAKQNGFGGANYIISFACGALIANTVLWVVMFLYYLCRTCTSVRSKRRDENLKEVIAGTASNAAAAQAAAFSTSAAVAPKIYSGSSGSKRRLLVVATAISDAWECMPPWYLRKLWIPGFVAGAILSLGMFGSILSVTYLGQAVGNSCVQSKILIR